MNQTLDLIDAILQPDGARRNPATLSELKTDIETVQDAYIEVIQQALRLLMQNRVDDCHALLQSQREELASTYERIGTLIQDVADTNEVLIKTIVEYLFTRARLVDELKMFPEFGMELLDRLTLDESIDATVDYMEAVMTGKKQLYVRVMNALTPVT